MLRAALWAEGEERVANLNRKGGLASAVRSVQGARNIPEIYRL
jgi:hypothetical protein